MSKQKRPKAVEAQRTLASLFDHWGGRLTGIAMALDRARLGPLPPKVLCEIGESFYAINRAQVYLRDAIRPVPVKRRKARRKA